MIKKLLYIVGRSVRDSQAQRHMAGAKLNHDRISACAVKGEKKIEPGMGHFRGQPDGNHAKDGNHRLDGHKSAAGTAEHDRPDTRRCNPEPDACDCNCTLPQFSFKKLDKHGEVKVSDPVSFYSRARTKRNRITNRLRGYGQK